VRRECLDHVIVLGVRHFDRVLKEYTAFFNSARPHQGLPQHVPGGSAPARSAGNERILALPVLGGLHHDYRAAA